MQIALSCRRRCCRECAVGMLVTTIVNLQVGMTEPTSEKTGPAERIGMAEETAMSETTSPKSRGRDKRTESRR